MAVRLLLPSVLVLALSLVPRSADAQTCSTSWAQPVDGSWSDPTRWTAGVPGADGTACITASGTYTVTLDVDQPLQRLEVGGASGTQTLVVARTFSTLGGGRIGPNGRVVNASSQACADCDGLPVITGTLLVEGELVHVPLAGLLSYGSSGTVDVAPGGRLLIDNAGPAPHSSLGSSGNNLLRIRGTLEANCVGTCQMYTPLDVQGGTVRGLSGVLFVNGGGTIDGATLDAAADAQVSFQPFQASWVLEGTLAGAPEGIVDWANATVAAGPADATLALGGTGFQLTASTFLSSAGGSFTNTGLLRRSRLGGNFSGLRAVVVRNEGTVEIHSSLPLYEGALLRNEPGGVVEITGTGGLGENGRLENAGLIVRHGEPGDFHFNGRLRSRPGSEIRVMPLSHGDLFLNAPGSQTLPAGAALTGGGRVRVPINLFLEGTVSPGTDAQPLDTLAVDSYFYPSPTAGSPRLVVDVGAGGQSDLLDVLPTNISENTRLAGALILRVAPGYTPQVGDTFTVLRTAGTIGGAFDVVVAEGEPEGIAFVAEVVALGTGHEAVVVRAVEAAPDGPITVSTRTPVGGDVRSIYLSGPGAAGVSSARLECTTCLDPDSLGTIPAEISGAGTLKEARFDLTSPRAYGYYDLVIQRPGKADTTVALTVRPYVSYIRTVPVTNRGIGVRPAGFGYNWSDYHFYNTTNVDEPAYTFASVGPEDEEQVAFALSSHNAFLHESETAPDPTAPALVVARVPAGEHTPLAYGQRVDPSDVLFPEQTPTGPDDPRIPFGDDRLFVGFVVQHTSFARAQGVVEVAVRYAHHDGLRAYVATVDAADPAAVRVAVRDALESQPRYVGGTAGLLARVLAGMNAAVPTPVGLAEVAATPFARTLDVAVYRLYADVEYAYHLDLADAPAAVRALLEAEYEALLTPAAAQRPSAAAGGAGSGLCRTLTRLVQDLNVQAAPPPPPTEVNVDAVIMCQMFQEAGSPPPPTEIDVTAPPPGHLPTVNLNRNLERTTRNLMYDYSAPSPFGPTAGSCGGGGTGAGGTGGASAGASCTPPAAPADPNDKTAETTLLCEFGTVVVDDEEVTRCVRYFVPLAEANEPLIYTIQFENLPIATASAEFVTVTDTLDTSLNPATFEVYAASHDSTFSYTVAGDVVTFRWVGIDLPPNVEEPEGQGFVTFGVRPDPGLPTGTVIENRASIVFDFNPAILTPTVTHEIRQVADLSTVIIAPDVADTGGPFTFEVVVANLQGDPAEEATVVIAAGGLPFTATPTSGTCSGAGPVTCTFGAMEAGLFERVMVVVGGAPPPGTYTLASTASTTSFDGFEANDSDAVTVTVVTVGGEEGSAFPREVTLAQPYPNPSRGMSTFRWGLPAAGRVDLRVYDLLGREVARLADDVPAEAGWHETAWDATVASGVYVVRFRSGDIVRARRLVVVR